MPGKGNFNEERRKAGKQERRILTGIKTLIFASSGFSRRGSASGKIFLRSLEIRFRVFPQRLSRILLPVGFFFLLSCVP